MTGDFMQYPMCVNLKGRKCIVLGGGRVALRKVLSLLDAEAEVLLIAPEAVKELEELSAAGKIIWRRHVYHPGELPRGFLLICAADDPAANRRAAEEARSFGMLVNAAAQPELSDFTVPASMRRGKLSLSVSTEQLSPACSRWIREALEREFPESFAVWLEFLSQMRAELKGKLPDSHAREQFWRKHLDQEIYALVKNGELEEAEVRIRNAVAGDRTES